MAIHLIERNRFSADRTFLGVSLPLRAARYCAIPHMNSYRIRTTIGSLVQYFDTCDHAVRLARHVRFQSTEAINNFRICFTTDFRFIDAMWHELDAGQTLIRLESSIDGLSRDEAESRRRQFGSNELVERDRRGVWRILWEQLQEPMVLLLVGAATISLLIHEPLDAAAIAAIVVLNAILGFVQDFRAERAMAALKRLATPEVIVRRDGEESKVSARELTRGDIVVLEAGNRVPADCRLIESHGLKIREAALTGESEAVDKQSAPISGKEVPLGDRKSMIYMGTDVSAGRGEAVVTEIGMATELGKIAGMLQGVPAHRTPLQRRLATMGVRLAIAAIAIVAVVFVIGILRGEPLGLMLMTSLSMAVAAVPEGLPAVATIALALGAKRMLRRNALIRRLPAVETLGSVTVICSDKTGTLTENRMHLSTLRYGGGEFDFESDLEGLWSVEKDGVQNSDSQIPPEVAFMLFAGALCNDAKLQDVERIDNAPATFDVVGDPTEAAFVIAAARFGIRKTELESTFPRVAEIPFDSERKRMTTVHEIRCEANPRVAELLQSLDATSCEMDRLVLEKGAADAVLDYCTHVLSDRKVQRLDSAMREQLIAANDQIAEQGKRVLGLAYRSIDGSSEDPAPENVEQGLTFLGLAGLIDPPRHEARSAVERCLSAGIRPVMITGDHPRTAQRIAADVGIGGKGAPLCGIDLQRHSEDELEAAVGKTSVYARVTPEHKLRIVKALQRNGEIVAMTGDGVNDAPALKAADIGVAMGITGTDVSKDASETVLLDDNFATIVNSVEEGRTIYDNIRKFLKYTMTSNTGEIWVMLLAPLAGMPLPLLPLQILWINLVTDGLPGLAMAVEPSERDTMNRPPRDPHEAIFDRGMLWHIGVVGLVMGLVSLLSGYWYWQGHSTNEYHASWGTIVFTVLTLSQMGHALAIRSSRDSLFSIGLLSNVPLLLSVLLTLALQLAVIYHPFFQQVFRTTALSWSDLLLCVLLSTVVFWVAELDKLVARIASHSSQTAS